MSRPSRREDLIESALTLFNANGFHAVGIDRILSEGGLAKMTLYRHFPSKDALILGVLEAREKSVNGWFAGILAASYPDGEARLLAVFDGLESWFENRSPLGPFYGCLFVKASAEFPQPGNTIHQAALEAKLAFVEMVAEAAAQEGFKKPRLLAREVSILKEGAIVMAHIQGTSAPASDARKAAKSLLATWPRKN
ncbi:MAG: TetR family transcriptional regulator [Rhodobiaceae bacterium]|nr:MAG: TetR family transcriptional regulator [Rhodobiaceae bacterium]